LTLTTRGVLLLVGSIAIAILTVYVGTRPILIPSLLLFYRPSQ
jgi:hypothetical protein